MGFLGGMAAGFKGMAGGEITQVTQAIEEGRIKAFDRLIVEAKQHGATGVTGVTSELKDFAGNTEIFSLAPACVEKASIIPTPANFSPAPVMPRNFTAIWTRVISLSSTPSATSLI